LISPLLPLPLLPRPRPRLRDWVLLLTPFEAVTPGGAAATRAINSAFLPLTLRPLARQTALSSYTVRSSSLAAIVALCARENAARAVKTCRACTAVGTSAACTSAACRRIADRLCDVFIARD
jgi:hypothetical protein